MYSQKNINPTNIYANTLARAAGGCRRRHARGPERKMVKSNMSETIYNVLNITIIEQRALLEQ